MACGVSPFPPRAPAVSETYVIARKSRGFVTGRAFHGYCVSGNLPEMPYPLTELVKASRLGLFRRLVDFWQVVQVGFPARDLLVVVVSLGHLLTAVAQLLLCRDPRPLQVAGR